MTEISLSQPGAERPRNNNFTSLPDRIWRWVRSLTEQENPTQKELKQQAQENVALTKPQQERRNILRNLRTAVATSFQEGMDGAVVPTTDYLGVPGSTATEVNQRIEAASQPQDLTTEMAAPARARDESRRQFLIRASRFAAGLAGAAIGAKVEPYVRAAREYAATKNKEATDGKAFELQQNVQSIFLDERGEWETREVPAFIAFQEAGFAGNGTDNQLFPGVGYDVLRMQSTTEEIKAKLAAKDIKGVVHDLRDYLAVVADRIDITYINPTLLQETVDTYLGQGVATLADWNNLITYSNPEGSMHKVFHDISFNTLASQDEARRINLQQTPAAIRQYLSSVPELASDPTIFNRIVNEIAAGNVVRFNNIGSEVRDILDKKSSRTKVGIPLVWAEEYPQQAAAP